MTSFVSLPTLSFLLSSLPKKSRMLKGSWHNGIVHKNFNLCSFASRPSGNFVLLSFALPHVLAQCHRDFLRLKKGRDKSDDIAKPFAKLPSPITLSLIYELTHIATCDMSTTGKFCKNLWWGLRYVFKRKMRGAE